MSESTHRQFKNKKFIYENKDMVGYIKAEISQIRRIVYGFKIRKGTESDSESES
jgi:hypothetical protein